MLEEAPRGGYGCEGNGLPAIKFPNWSKCVAGDFGALAGLAGVAQVRQSCMPGHTLLLLCQAPLHDTLSGPRAKGSHPIIWTPYLHRVLEECKTSLSHTILLAHPDPVAPL
jgi:hypothetical protein